MQDAHEYQPAFEAKPQVTGQSNASLDLPLLPHFTQNKLMEVSYNIIYVKSTINNQEQIASKSVPLLT